MISNQLIVILFIITNTLNLIQSLQMKSNRFCIINCENSKTWSPIFFEEMFIKLLSQPDDEWTAINVANGDTLPHDLIEYKGVVITGSHFNCRDKESIPWFDNLCEFIRLASTKEQIRLYGGCFGCQIIAYALGGIVDYNPNKRFILKAETVVPNHSNFVNTFNIENPLDGYKVLVSHGDCVKVLPEHSVLLASSVSCSHEIYVTGKYKNILAFQSHPEFELQYAIKDRIWPRVVEDKKRLSAEEITVALESFKGFNNDDANKLGELISNFLHK